MRTQLAEQEIKLEVDRRGDGLPGRAGYDPAFGARPLRRVIQNLIEDPLAEGLLDGRFQAGLDHSRRCRGRSAETDRRGRGARDGSVARKARPNDAVGRRGRLNCRPRRSSLDADGFDQPDARRSLRDGGSWRRARTIFVCQQCGARSPALPGSVPELRRVEHRWSRRSRADGSRRRIGTRPRRHRARAPLPLATGRAPTTAADPGPDRRARPRAGRRDRAGLARADRRRSRHRQIDAPAAGGGGARRAGIGRCSTSRARSRRSRSGCAPTGWASRRRPLGPRRDQPRATCSPRPRQLRPRSADRRLDPDHLSSTRSPRPPAASPRCASAPPG